MTPRLNRSVALERLVRQADDAGGYTEAWETLGTLFAEIVPRTGRATETGGADVFRMGLKITVRAMPFGSEGRPSPGQRFREGARAYVIEAVAERDPDGRYLICFAKEEVVA